MDKTIEENADFIAQLAEMTALAHIVAAQDEEIKRLKAQRDQAVEVLEQLTHAILLFLSVEPDLGNLGDAYNKAAELLK